MTLPEKITNFWYSNRVQYKIKMILITATEHNSLTPTACTSRYVLLYTHLCKHLMLIFFHENTDSFQHGRNNDNEDIDHTKTDVIHI